MTGDNIITLPLRIKLTPELAKQVAALAADAGVDPAAYATVLLHTQCLEKLNAIKQLSQETRPSANDPDPSGPDKEGA